MITNEIIEIAERNKRAWEYIRRSQKQREMLRAEVFPGWFSYVLAISFFGCIGIWLEIFRII